MMKYQRLIWASLLIVAGVMLLMWHLQSHSHLTDASGQPAAPQAAATQATQPGSSPVITSAPTAETKPAARMTGWPVSRSPVHEVLIGSTDKADGYKFQVQLTSLGAAVKTIKLTEYLATVADKRRCEREKNHDDYLRAVSEEPKLKGHYSLLNPVGLGRKKTYPLATRRITIVSGGKKVRLDLSGPRWKAGQTQDVKDEKGEIQGQSVTFESKVWRNQEAFLLVKKTYTVKKGSYSVGVRLEVENLCKDGKAKFSLTQFLATGVPREDIQSDNRMLTYGRYEDGELKVPKPLPIKDARDMAAGLGGAKGLGRSDDADAVLWLGQTNKFFAALTYILPAESGSLAAPQAKAAFSGAALAETSNSKTFLAVVDMGPFELPAGKSEEVALDLFAGPKRSSLFDETPLYKSLQYKKTIHFGSCCSVPFLSLAMMWLLDFFSNRITFGNYGLAIILLVFLVRLVLHPLTKKGQVSMARMQKLAPEMAKIKEKYANDKAKQNEETMKLYKTQGATPILGCLPMLLQMPIWIALWTGLRALVELRHAAFLPVWITDLASPDALICWANPMTTFHLPMVGPIWSFNLLPLLLAVAMALQQKFSPSAPQAAGAGQQAGMQKQMMYFMTGFFLLIFYNAPSGLTLYIMSSTFAGLAEQYVIRKHIREKEAAEAAAETKVAIPGKRFRGQKPKKPKGPFQIKR